MAESTVAVVVTLFLAIAFFTYLIMIYNGLVLLNVNIGKAWANIDVLLKQRHDEIPNLIAVVKGYKDFEKRTITDLTEARTDALSASSVVDQGQAQKTLTGALGRLMAVAENYPQLKAQGNFLALQKRLSELESEIADRRSFYNDSVAAYNARISEAPDLFIANAMKLRPHELFQATENEKDVVKVELAS